MGCWLHRISINRGSSSHYQGRYCDASLKWHGNWLEIVETVHWPETSQFLLYTELLHSSPTSTLLLVSKLPSTSQQIIWVVTLCKKESQLQSKKMDFSQEKSRKSQKKVKNFDFSLTFLDWNPFFLTVTDFLFYRGWQLRRLNYLFFGNLIFPPPIVSHFDHTLRPLNNWCFITSSRCFIQVALTHCLTTLGGLAIACLCSGVIIKCTQLFRPCLLECTALCSFGRDIQFALMTRAFIVVIFVCLSPPFLAYWSQ